jgi:hypothetical protein
MCSNAGEEALKENARQMTIKNNFELLRELWQQNVISHEEYIAKLKRLWMDA